MTEHQKSPNRGRRVAVLFVAVLLGLVALLHGGYFVITNLNFKEVCSRTEGGEPRQDIQERTPKPTPRPRKTELVFPKIRNLPQLPSNYFPKKAPLDHIPHPPNAKVSTTEVTKHGYTFEIETHSSPNWNEHRVKLPAYDWDFPKGLTKRQKELLWMQPENRIHFDDAPKPHISVVWEAFNSSVPVSVAYRCERCIKSHHVNSYEVPKPETELEDDTAIVFGGHYIDLFQHFHDNGIPHISLLFAVADFDVETTQVYTNAKHPNTMPTLLRMGFKSENIHQVPWNARVKARRVIFPVLVDVVHPYYYSWFKDTVKVPEVKRDKIFFLYRGQGAGGNPHRVITNQKEVVAALQKKYGKDKVIGYTPKNNYDEMVKDMSTAKVIMGSHGGAFYHQFYAKDDTTIIEFVPLTESGMYPSQHSWLGLPFAHMAMWSNTLLLGQEFWRYYTMSSSINYDVDIPDLLKYLDTVPAFKKQ